MQSLVAQRREPSGYTYTIASRVSHALREVEDLFGPKAPGFFYAGHEFRNSNPQLWFPGNCGHVVMQLSLECMQDFNQAIFQLSHEVVHLLGPQAKGNSTHLEEGMATWFSERYTLRETGRAIRSQMPCYAAARDAVATLMEADPTCIRRMREEQPFVSKITSGMVSRFCPDLPEDQARFLCEPFVRSA